MYNSKQMVLKKPEINPKELKDNKTYKTRIYAIIGFAFLSMALDCLPFYSGEKIFPHIVNHNKRRNYKKSIIHFFTIQNAFGLAFSIIMGFVMQGLKSTTSNQLLLGLAILNMATQTLFLHFTSESSQYLSSFIGGVASNLTMIYSSSKVRDYVKPEAKNIATGLILAFAFSWRISMTFGDGGNAFYYLMISYTGSESMEIFFLVLFNLILVVFALVGFLLLKIAENDLEKEVVRIKFNNKSSPAQNVFVNKNEKVNPGKHAPNFAKNVIGGYQQAPDGGQANLKNKGQAQGKIQSVRFQINRLFSKFPFN